MKNLEDQKIRRTALAAWIESNGGVTNIIQERALDPKIRSRISNILQGYSFGSVAARNLEDKLGLPLGWFDSEEAKDISKLSTSFDENRMSKQSTGNGLNTNRVSYRVPGFPISKLSSKYQMLTGYRSPSNSKQFSKLCLIADMHLTPAWLLKFVPQITHIDNLYVITGFENSTNPSFNEGDPMLIDTGIKTVDDDDIYLFQLNGMVFIKKLQRNANREIRVMHSENLYDSWIVKINMDLKILGKIIKIWQSDSMSY